MKDQVNASKVVGLQIGGRVGPNDRVGMHVPMPNEPGVGVSVTVDAINVDEKVKEIIRQLPDNNPKAEEVRRIAREVLNEKDEQSKIEKVRKLIEVGKNIAQIASIVATIGGLYSVK